jgi:hypothetical protein
MYLWGTLMGLITAIIPCILMQVLFGNTRIRGRERPLVMGVLFGLFVWVIAGAVIHADQQYDIIGFMKKETGGTLMEIFRHSHFGFLLSGLSVALLFSMLTGRDSGGGGEK